ncbi:LacI family DNA-binding transcriptional regulator [Streptomyces chartreusis]|uniref:LacI family DNA-binding transcriptional regulator n=1 Tax=Streptomyces chartreusis TaxID=1969 RepID=UPI003D8E3420
MTATSKDVARLAGVSQPTVSRALRGSSGVSLETKRRVEKAARELRYVLSERGRALSTRRNRRVGIVISDLTNPFYPHLVAPLYDLFARHGFQAVLFTGQDDDGPAFEELVDGSLDGLVLATCQINSTLPDCLAGRGMPFVFLNRETDAAADSATVDNTYGAELVGDLLAELGHRSIGAIFGPPATSTGRDREAGFRSSLARCGLSLRDDCVTHVPYAFDRGCVALESLMGLSDPPTALFCGNDVIALGALNKAAELGISVPGDLTIVGFDDITLAAWQRIQLTTVHCDLEELALTAGELLLKRIADPGRPHVRKAQRPRLVLRQSHASVTPSATV